MLNAIALDDERPGLDVLENFCKQTELVKLVKTFTQPSEAQKYLKEYPVDLLFLDIQMPSISGIEFYKNLKEETMVIFTTAFSQYAVEGFNLQAIDYLLKPFTFDRFLQAVSRAKDFYEYQHRSDSSTNHFFIRADYSLIKINYGDILYIEGLDDYLRIHLDQQKPIVARMTMKVILEKLPPLEFLRVHRSYIISVSRVKQIRNKVILIGEREIPIGTSYEKDISRIYKP